MSAGLVDSAAWEELKRQVGELQQRLPRRIPQRRRPVGGNVTVQFGIVADTGHSKAEWQEKESGSVQEKLEGGKLVKGKVMVWVASGETVNRNIDPVEWEHIYTGDPEEGQTVAKVGDLVFWLQCEVPDTYVKKADVSN